MRVGLENMTPARVYDVEIGLGDGDSWQLNGPTEPSPPGVRKTDVIEPGEIWWSTWDLIPDIETGTAKIDIAQSLIRRISGVDGEDGTAPDAEDIIREPGEDGEDPPPPPKLQSSAKPGGVVALSWDVVDDADGYEIWATKRSEEDTSELQSLLR